MSKRMQQATGEERLVAKSKPMLNLVPRSAASSPTAPSLSASSRPEVLSAPSQQGSNLKAQCAGKPAAGDSSQNDAASSSQVRPTDAKLSECARKLAATGRNQDQIFFEIVSGNLHLKSWTSTTRTTRSGRTISVYPELAYHTLRKSTRI